MLQRNGNARRKEKFLQNSIWMKLGKINCASTSRCHEVRYCFAKHIETYRWLCQHKPLSWHQLPWNSGSIEIGSSGHKTLMNLFIFAERESARAEKNAKENDIFAILSIWPLPLGTILLTANIFVPFMHLRACVRLIENRIVWYFLLLLLVSLRLFSLLAQPDEFSSASLISNTMNRKSGNNTPAIGELNWTARAKCSCPPHKSFASLRVDEQVTRVRLLMVCVAIGKTGYESDPKTNELEQEKGSRFIDAYLVVEREKKYREDVCVFYGRIDGAYDGRARCVCGTTRLSNFFLIIFDWVIFHRKNQKTQFCWLIYYYF